MRGLLIAAVLLLALPAHAEDPHDVRRALPPVETTILEGVPHKCLSVPQWQQVLLLSNAYQGLYDWRLTIQGALSAHQDVIKAYELKLTGYENQLKMKDKYIAFQKDHIANLTKKHRNAALEERLEKYVMWAVIIAETVVIGVIGAKSL